MSSFNLRTSQKHSKMALATSETIWSTMITMRQLSSTYYTIATCLADLLHRYFDSFHSQTDVISSSLLHSLRQSLFSSVPAQIKPTNQAKLLAEYANVLQSILKQNSLHTNIIQNVRRLFRSDSCLTQLFTSIVDEYCQCLECDCTISNSTSDVIHDVGQLRPTLLTESSQTSCACFRCGDQNQMKTLRFKLFGPCLALTVNHLQMNATDRSTTQLVNAQGIAYDVVYIIELDPTARCSILNVYQRQDAEFVKVDGADVSSRTTTIDCRGKLLTLWLSSTSESRQQTVPSESLTTTTTDTFLSPPQSASSSSQLIPNSTPKDESAAAIDPNPYETQSSITFDDIALPSSGNIGFDDDQFWNEFDSQTTAQSNTDTSSLTKIEDTRSSSPATTVSDGGNSTTTDTVSDIYLTLLNSTNKKSSNPRVEHDMAVNSLVSNVIWPMLVKQSARRSQASSSSATTTAPSLSSNSSHGSSSVRRDRTLKHLPSLNKTRRTRPYTTTSSGKLS